MNEERGRERQRSPMAPGVPLCEIVYNRWWFSSATINGHPEVEEWWLPGHPKK